MDIVFDNVSFAYDASRQALDGVSCTVPAGQFVTLIGANGSGKSTFAKLVNALYVPSEGIVRVGGLDTAVRQNALEIRSNVGMVFQNPDNQAVASVVEDDVAFGPENLGLSPEEIGKRVHGALERVRMLQRAKDEIQALSGGQKQLVAIAGALAMEPKVLVLDEPGAMLDVRGRAEVMRTIAELKEQGMTVVLVTHFMDEALAADRVIVLSEGKIALDGTPDEVFSQVERIEELKLELPFPFDVARRLGAAGLDVGRKGGMRRVAEEVAQLLAGRTAQADSARQLQEPADDAACAPLVVFDNVSFAYGAGREVLHDVRLEVREGAFLGLIGSTGSGKSTVTQLMNGLLVPASGRVTVCGRATDDRRALRQVRADVGLVFQYPEQQLFAATVEQDVAFGPRNLGLGEDEVEQRCREALAAVGLDYDEYAQRNPFSLSGGQRRRAALAGVLAMRPRVLVLDEPAAGMDPATNAQIKEYLRKLNEGGMAIVLVSHSMDDVAQLCGEVVCLDGGKIVLQGSPGQVFSSEHAAMLRQIGLGVPHAVDFALELAQRGCALPGPVLTCDQLVEAVIRAKGSNG